MIATLAIMTTGCSSDSASDIDLNKNGRTVGPRHLENAEAATEGTVTGLVVSGGPRISFDQEYVHLGEATPDQQINYSFTFKNIGDDPLIVYDVKIKTMEGC